MKRSTLFNKKSREDLKESLKAESFKRITASFYKYFTIDDPNSFRDMIYIKWDDLHIFGRIYIASEGINAQLSVPENHWEKFIATIIEIKNLENVSIKKALDDGHSFYKLTIKVREELVAYHVPSDTFDMKKTGKHLNAEQYNKALENSEAIVVDMRNYYESEIGRFENALIPDVETSKELLPKVKKMLNGNENKQILLYCTGGIRCEKASAYLIQNGFKNINQLQGGIIQYAHDVKEKGLQSKFRGKNFVFDQRLGERVTDDIISFCHICGLSCDSHTDCKNDACHILFIQCEKCREEFDGCCSKECKSFAELPIEEQKTLRKDPERMISKTFFDSRVKPKLNT